MDFENSQTKKNLETAFAGESQAHTKYRYYASPWFHVLKGTPVWHQARREPIFCKVFSSKGYDLNAEAGKR